MTGDVGVIMFIVQMVYRFCITTNIDILDAHTIFESEITITFGLEGFLLDFDVISLVFLKTNVNPRRVWPEADLGILGP